MIIAFVENRYATRLYSVVARHLETLGHQIHWIVQNPMFRQRFGTEHAIPFPAKRCSGNHPNEVGTFERIAATDRQILYYGGTADHYSHYLSFVDEIIDRVRPDVVFGESTHFYELLAIEVCRRRGIQYLNPVTVGCPPGRFYFLSYDSKDPVGGEHSALGEDAALALIGSINERRTAPSYMHRPPVSALKRALIRAIDRCTITCGWVMGERFTTPSPWQKVKRELAQRKLRERWEKLASGFCPIEKPYVLYALHVQPECSIDVWGCAWRDQAQVIARTAAALAKAGMVLAVKPHPNSKYEVTEKLCHIVAEAPNIVPIPGRVSMGEVLPGAAGVLGITGTVLLEAVIAGKPAISVGPNAMSKYPGITEIQSPEEIVWALDAVGQSNRFSSGGTALELVQWLYQVSYSGEIFEPLFSPENLLNGHTDELCAAFSDVVSKLPQPGLRQSPAAAVSNSA